MLWCWNPKVDEMEQEEKNDEGYAGLIRLSHPYRLEKARPSYQDQCSFCASAWYALSFVEKVSGCAATEAR